MLRAQDPHSGVLEESFYGAFFHYWSNKKWLSFGEHISAKLRVELDCSTPKSAKLEIMRSTGVIMSTCRFSFPIDNQSWKFLQNGTKVIVCNVESGAISKFLLDMDTKTEANSLLSRLQHHSHQARLQAPQEKDIFAWMQENEHKHLNDSSMDETSTTSLDEAQLPETTSSDDVWPIQDLPTAFSAHLPQTSQPDTPFQNSQHNFSSISSTSSAPPSSTRSQDSTRYINTQDEPFKLSSTRYQENGNFIDTLQDDLFRDLQADFYDDIDRFGQSTLPEPENLSLDHHNLDFSLQPHPAELNEYYSIVREAQARFHSMTSDELQNWMPEA